MIGQTIITFRSKKANQVDPDLDESLSGVFSEHELAAMTRLGAIMAVEAGWIGGREGEPGHEVFVILEGDAAVSRNGEVIADIGPGAVVGEMSILDNAPRNATLEATTAMRVAVFSAREFSDLLAQCPRLDAEIRRVADERRTES